MKSPAAIVGVILASSCSSIHGRSGSIAVTSYVPTSVGFVGSRSYPSLAARVRMNYHDEDHFPSVRPAYAYSNPRKSNTIVCHMSEENDGADETEESPKRGVFKRMREKMSTTFSGIKKGDDSQSDQGGSDTGYKPNPIDGIRLRLAMAMSNLNLFQFGQKEWVVACPKTRVGPGQVVPCVVNGLDVIIFASRDGQRLDAFANACPHLGSPFDLATVERKPVVQDKGRRDDGTGDGCVDCIVCPVHRTAFEIESGDVRGEWCPYPPIIGGMMGYVKPKTSLVKFAVRLRGKNVEVRIATSLKSVGIGKEEADGMKDIK